MTDRIITTYAWDNVKEQTNTTSNFAAIYNEHNVAIYRYILARVGHIEDAQDLTAQVFLKAYKHAASYRQEASIIYWLIGIARNQVIDHHKRSIHPPDTMLTDDIPNTTPSPETVFERSNRLKRVTEALNALSEDRREAITMRLFAGLNNKEIAEIMGKSADAVAMLVHRGIQDLKTRLGNEDLS